MGIINTFGAICLVAMCLFFGFMQVQQPDAFAQQMMKGNLPTLLQKAQLAKHIPGFKFTEKEAKILVQAVGGLMMCFSLLVIVDLGRRPAAFLLALVLVAVTVCQHLNIADITKTSMPEQIQAFKNLGMIGGLLYVAGTREHVAKAKQD